MIHEHHFTKVLGAADRGWIAGNRRLPVVAADGTLYPKGTAIPVRADFNSLDNPFAWSERPDEVGVTPAAGLEHPYWHQLTLTLGTGQDWALDTNIPAGTYSVYKGL